MYENYVICYIVELAMRSSAWLTSLSLPRSPDVVQPNSGAGAQQAPGYKSLCAFCIAARALVVFSYVFGVVAVILSYYYSCGSIGSGLLTLCMTGARRGNPPVEYGLVLVTAITWLRLTGWQRPTHPLCILWWRWSFVLLVLLLS